MTNQRKLKAQLKKQYIPSPLGSLMGGKEYKVCNHSWIIQESNNMVTILVCRRCQENRIIEKKFIVMTKEDVDYD